MYMLKLRRREVLVSSTLLWELVLRDRQANTPWQRLRRNLLLLLQILILAALVIGLARPAAAVPSVATGPVVVLLDASASMAAADVRPSRFEAARSAARELVDGLESGARMSLILVGKQPRVLASAESDRAALRRTLETIPEEEAPTQGAANWPAAFALAAGAVAARAGSESGEAATIVILSDGRLPAEGLPPLPGEVRYIPVGETGENLAISALALRSGAQGAELFAQVTNYGRAARAALLSFYLDDQFFSAEQIEVPPGEQRSLTLTGLPGRAVIYRAQITNPVPQAGELDAFPLDDTAFAVYQPARGGQALLVSAGNLFLEQLLAAIPGITPFRALADETGKIQFPEERFDLYVLDGITPGELPEADLLWINPPSNPLFEVTGVFSNTGQARAVDHPLVRYVDWSSVHVRQARQVRLPGWADVLVQSEGGPLVFAGETGGRRIAVVAFDLHDSDLPLQVAFPILFSSLLNYLSPAQAFEAPEGLQPGESVRIGRPPAADSGQPDRIAVASPGGKVFSMQAGEEGVTFSETDELGVYAVNYLSTGDSQDIPPAGFFAVNLFDELESDLRPAENLQIGRSAIPPAAKNQLGRREFWPALALLALLVLMLEWIVYHRRNVGVTGSIPASSIRQTRASP
jgi:hypothetical protein